MNETEKKEIAQKFITGLSNRDANLLKSIMTDDVVWSLPGKSLMSGEAHGVDAILKRSEILHQYEVKFELEHVVFGYQDVALHLHNTGKRGDKILDEHLTTVCSLRGNNIRRLDTFISDVEMLNAFFV
jgi:ketosteroid isomerase-like protein